MQGFQHSTLCEQLVLSCSLPVVENDDAKILWDFRILTNIRIPNNRPGIVIFFKKCHQIMFAEVLYLVLLILIFEKEDEKISK